MPADIWVNISGSNKQYLKGYVNIDGVWRNIEKIWVNISGTWKEVGFQYILDYVGTGSDITNASAYAASGVVGNYAVIAGGYGNTSSNPSHNIVTAYTENLIKTTPTALATARQGAFSGSNPSYLLIGGGFNNNGGYTNQLSTVETYNTSLARGTASSLSQARGNGASGCVGNYVVFYCGDYSDGGYHAYSLNVDAYSLNLTRTTLYVTWDVSRAGAASIGNYVIFAGGSRGTQWYTVEAFNTSLVKTTLTDLPAEGGPSMWAGASNSNYAIMAGGISAPTYAWNSSLTRTTLTNSLPNKEYARDNAGTSHSKFAVFSGGYGLTPSTYYFLSSAQITYYDTSLVRYTDTLPTTICQHCMETLGDSIIIFGGWVYPGTSGGWDSGEAQKKVYK